MEKPKKPFFTFIDLFAGIGGFRLGLERVGGRCVYSCEIDKFAAQTYEAWYGDKPDGDIKLVDPKNIPNHDILTGGFPCKSFSRAGVSQRKGSNKEHGFQDGGSGNLFFDIIRVLQVKKPPVVYLENVSDFYRHDGGKTYEITKDYLETLGYKVFSEILDAKYHVPQHRERIMIVGLRTKVFGKAVDFTFPEQSGPIPKLKSILEKNPDDKFTLTDKQWNYHQDRKKKNQAAGKGFGYRLADPEKIAWTISSRYHKDGSDMFIPQEGKNPRRLTPREAGRLMGFPDEFPIVVSNTQAYRQFGNAVVPQIVESVGKQIVEVFFDYLQTHTLIGGKKT